MQTFDGFSNGKAQITGVPSQFFSDLLPLIDDLAELKVTLFCIWALQQKEGDYRYLRFDEFTTSDTLIKSLQTINPSGKVEDTLNVALDKAQERGTLLTVTIKREGESVTLYFMNTPRGRDGVEQITAGQWRPDGKGEIEILPVRPNIYRLYEENIGALTPLIAQSLEEAEKDYSIEWVESAIQCAVDNNARKWSYIITVLERWKQEGRSNYEARRGQSEQQGGYASGEWADIINS